MIYVAKRERGLVLEREARALVDAVEKGKNVRGWLRAVVSQIFV